MFTYSVEDEPVTLEAGVSTCIRREIVLGSILFPVLLTDAIRSVPSFLLDVETSLKDRRQKRTELVPPRAIYFEPPLLYFFTISVHVSKCITFKEEFGNSLLANLVAVATWQVP